MNLSDMWSVWDTRWVDKPLCYCESSDDARKIQSYMTYDVAVIVYGPGDGPHHVKGELVHKVDSNAEVKEGRR